MLSKLLSSAHFRFNLALSLTAGWDSRILLAASKYIINDMFAFTFILENMALNSTDLLIPQSILKKNKITYHILDCRSKIDPEYYELCKTNVDFAHEYYSNSTFGMFGLFPQERVCVKGSCSEIARCFYYLYGVHDEIVSPFQLAALEQGWSTIPFVVDYLEKWLVSAVKVCNDSNMDILDLFYWEHRMGGWLAQGWLEFDIVQESFSPFNYRPLLENMLGTPIKYRRSPDYLLYRRIINCLWPDLLNWPVNPTSGIKSMEHHFRKLHLDMGVYNQVRNKFTILKNLIHA